MPYVVSPPAPSVGARTSGSAVRGHLALTWRLTLARRLALLAADLARLPRELATVAASRPARAALCSSAGAGGENRRCSRRTRSGEADGHRGRHRRLPAGPAHRSNRRRGRRLRDGRHVGRRWRRGWLRRRSGWLRRRRGWLRRRRDVRRGCGAFHGRAPRYSGVPRRACIHGRDVVLTVGSNAVRRLWSTQETTGNTVVRNPKRSQGSHRSALGNARGPVL